MFFSTLFLSKNTSRPFVVQPGERFRTNFLIQHPIPEHIDIATMGKPWKNLDDPLNIKKVGKTHGENTVPYGSMPSEKVRLSRPEKKKKKLPKKVQLDQ